MTRLVAVLVLTLALMAVGLFMALGEHEETLRLEDPTHAKD
jgi:hypothetical protein